MWSRALLKTTAAPVGCRPLLYIRGAQINKDLDEKTIRQPEVGGQRWGRTVVTQAETKETFDIFVMWNPQTVHSTWGWPLFSLLCFFPHFLSSPAASYLARAHGPCRVWFSLPLALLSPSAAVQRRCERLVPIRSSSLFSRHWQPAIWDPLSLITPPLDSLTMHPPLLLPLLCCILYFPS